MLSHLLTNIVISSGPLNRTVSDFWRMIWECDVTAVVMLTNLQEKGKQKCHPYWPETGTTTYGDIAVETVEKQVLPDYTIRTLKVENVSKRQ